MAIAISRPDVRLSVALMCVCMVHALPLAALTIHRSFRAREVGFGARSAGVPPAYLAAESAAKAKHLGLWTSLLK